jgi:DNA polymerase
MGAEKFRRTLEIGQGGISVKIDINEAERIVRLYRQKNWKIVQFWQQCGNALRNMLSGVERELHPQITCTTKGIRLPNGFYIQYPGLRETANGFEYISDARSFQKAQAGEQAAIPWTRIYGGKVTENCVQALAALVIREQMSAAGRHFKVAFQVHDEIIVAVPDKDVETAEAKLIGIMCTPPKWAPDLPVACDWGNAKNYGDT